MARPSKATQQLDRVALLAHQPVVTKSRPKGAYPPAPPPLGRESATMAAPPSPALCSASPCRVATRLAPPASSRAGAASRLLVSSGGGCCRGAQGSSGLRRLVARPPVPFAARRGGGRGEVAAEDGDGTRALLQAALWGAEAAYILWLFLLPYAPVRAVSSKRKSLLFQCFSCSQIALHLSSGVNSC